MLPDGSVIIHVGMQNHGQGHETSLAQIAAHELGLDPAQISIRYGDTATSPFGFGTFASRSIVFAGGAVARILPRARREDPAHRRASAADAMSASVRIENGAVSRPRGSVAIAEIAHAANVRQELLPDGMEPLLENDSHLRADRDRRRVLLRHACGRRRGRSGHRRGRDPDYVVAEDCGTMINPMIVDGQVQGGIAQGIGTALLRGNSL